MMKLKLVLAAAALALTAPAFAADLPVYQEPAAPAYLYSWTGPYIGLHLGYGWGDVDAVYTNGGIVNPLYSDDYDLDGFSGGIQLGYNMQFDSFVVGIETDLSFANIDGNSDFLGLQDALYSSSIDWYGTTRLRAGFAADNLLFYVTGGVAYGNIDHTYNDPGFFTSSISDTEFGWTMGAGLEYGFASNWSIKAEYLYVDLGSQRDDLADAGLPGEVFDYDTRFHTVRAGLNYKF